MLSEDIEIRKHFVSQKINNFTKISVQCIMCCPLLNRKAGRDKMGTLYSRLQKNPVHHKDQETRALNFPIFNTCKSDFSDL
jgi:hypothetical protein